MLRVGQIVRAEVSQMDLTVERRLGEGGQGIVYLVKGPNNTANALKWYNSEQATEEQREAIRKLVTQDRPPRGMAGRRFIWPLDLVTAEGSRQFGYLMPLIDTRRFTDLGEVMAGRRPAPGWDVLCEISRQMVHSYRALHLSGYCYRDISRGNVLFDPLQGDVLICDNDNVGHDGQSTCQVWGTFEYMAPELIRGEEAHPSTKTDLHALAVLLFQLWTWHHPLHGQQEYAIRCWDFQAKKLIYGIQPIFIFDPNDARNRLPADPDYQTAARRWASCPPSLQELFVRAFTDGLRDPRRRVAEGEWLSVFLQLKDGAVRCPGCQAVNLWDPKSQSLTCWHCRKAMPVPPRLRFQRPTGAYFVLLTADAKLRRRHTDPHADEDSADDVLGEVVRHPTDPNAWGLRNLSPSPWVASSADGNNVTVPPQKSIRLTAGLKVHLLGTMAELIP